MSGRYREIGLQDFSALMAEMGFRAADIERNVSEYVFERPFKDPRFVVRIYSSIDIHTRTTRECGADAIRVILFDRELCKKSYSGTVHRTLNAEINTRARARDAWRWGLNYRCSCGAMMKERLGSSGKFLGCTDYPVCKKTQPLYPLCKKPQPSNKPE